VLSKELLVSSIKKELCDVLVRLLSDEVMDKIYEVEVNKVEYKYAKYQNEITYIKEVSMYFMLRTLVGDYDCRFEDMILKISLDLDKGYIDTYLDFSETGIDIRSSEDDYEDSLCNESLGNYLKDKKLLSKRIHFSGKVYKNNISNILYSNRCCVIWHNEEGVSISKIDKDIDEVYEAPKVYGLYRYKNYLFMLHSGNVFNLVILNTKSNSLAVWNSNTSPTGSKQDVLSYYFYYLSTIDAFVFLTTTLDSLLLIDKKNHR
jgi:hypothetical protein